MHCVVHPAHERGGADYGWLKTRHSFSFASWYEPSRMGFGALRVLNDDWIAPQSGFGAHPHRDMEIITIVREGAVTHADSMGTESVVPLGDIQVMSAGTGVVHSERNTSVETPLSLFQIWIEPNVRGVAPRYGQMSYPTDAGVHMLVAPEGSGVPDALSIYQDAYIAYGTIERGDAYRYRLHTPGHGVYLFVESGVVDVGMHEAEETELNASDAAGFWDISELSVRARERGAVLFIEVPMRDG